MKRDKDIENRSDCILIAEIGQAHEGSLGLAHSYIDAVAEAGADAVKFQVHFAAEESTEDDVFRVNFSKQDSSRYNYWKRMEFSDNDWQGLVNHANENNITFLASAFSVRAVQLLVDLGVSSFKLASGELSNPDILKTLGSAGLTTYLSTGMSSWKEIDEVVAQLKEYELPLTIMQCTSEYPTPLSHVGINVLDELSKRYGTAVGLSDHSGLVHPGLTAIGRGAAALEVHVVFDKRMFGPDASSSLTIDDLRFLCEYRDALHVMTMNPIDKDDMAGMLDDIKKLFSRSLAPTRDLRKEEVLTADLISFKKPGTGISITELSSLIGKTLKRNVASNRLFKLEDFYE